MMSSAVNAAASLNYANESIIIPNTTFRIIVVISRKKAISKKNLMK